MRTFFILIAVLISVILLVSFILMDISWVTKGGIEYGFARTLILIFTFTFGGLIADTTGKNKHN